MEPIDYVRQKIADIMNHPRYEGGVILDALRAFPELKKANTDQLRAIYSRLLYVEKTLAYRSQR